MINTFPINTVPLAGALGGGSALPVEPQYHFSWSVKVVIAGVDMTAQLTGAVEIDREEGAAGIANFSLFIYPGTPVVPTDWLNATVTIDLLITQDSITTTERLLTGFLAQPVWDSVNRILMCECSDNLQQRVEALGVASIDGLCGGYWSADVFEPVEGRSHWDYALERLSTVRGSLDCSATGGLRVTPWAIKPVAQVFGEGTTLYQSVSVDLAEASSITNRVEVEFSYRYRRLWQHNKKYSWLSPEAGGSAGITGFCQWRQNSHELPTIEMIEDEARDAGETLLSPAYHELPPSMPNPCGDGVAWVNNQVGLLLGVEWVGARRWAQVVTEKQPLVFTATNGDIEGKQVVQRTSYTLDIETERAKTWESDPILDGTSGAQDEADEVRRRAVFDIAAQTAVTEITAAHRRTTVSWSVPAAMAKGLDLTHTLELNDQGVHAVGKVRRLVYSLDFDSGEALTHISIAVMRGGGVSSAMVMPDRLGTLDPDDDDGFLPVNTLPTQLGGRPSSPAYDDELPGFAGNYSVIASGAQTYPRRIAANTDELEAERRDEHIYTGEPAAYSVGIANNTLELL